MDQSERTLLADKDVPGDWPGPAVPQLTHVANQPITKTSENTAHLSRPSALTCGNDWADSAMHETTREMTRGEDSAAWGQQSMTVI